MYVYVSVCMSNCVFMSVSVSVSIYTCLIISVSLCTCICICICVYAAGFCPAGTDVHVDVISKKHRPNNSLDWAEEYDNYVPTLNRGISFDEEGHLQAHGTLRLGYIRAVDGKYSISVRPLTVTLVHCHTIIPPLEREDML